MRDYGKVTPTFWIGETGKKLRGDAGAQVLALYLMTSPHSIMTGVFHCPVLYMAHETGLGLEGASKALARLLQEGFCEYDEASESVFVVRMASFQIAQSLKAGDKRILGLQREVEKMQPAVLRERFIATYSEAFKLGETGKNASPYQAPCKPLPSQEQEQEQEQEQDKGERAKPQSDLPPAHPASPEPTVDVVARIPLVDKTEFQITREMLAEWTETFPAVDVMAALLRMRAWSNANPANKKTARGVSAFIVRWLGKEQDNASRSPGRQSTHEGIFAGAI